MPQKDQTHRHSYHRHKERLANIRHHLNEDFFQDSHPRPADKKGMLQNQHRQHQINRENDILKKKIDSIKVRSAHDTGFSGFNRTENLRNNLVRYEEEGKFEIKSDLDDGEPIKCIIPTRPKTKSSYAPLQRANAKSFSSRPDIVYVPQPKKGSFNRSRNTSQSSRHKIPSQSLYFLPERNENRTVIHHKTLSKELGVCLFELSVIEDRLLITVNVMIRDKYVLTELCSLKRSQQIQKEYHNDYDRLFENIILEQKGQKYTGIKIGSEKNETKVLKSKESIRQDSKAIRDDFIKRNYYLRKQTEPEKKDSEIEKGQKTTIVSQQKIHQIVNRLSANKTYSRDKKQITKVQNESPVVKVHPRQKVSTNNIPLPNTIPLPNNTPSHPRQYYTQKVIKNKQDSRNASIESVRSEAKGPTKRESQKEESIKEEKSKNNQRRNEQEEEEIILVKIDQKLQTKQVEASQKEQSDYEKGFEQDLEQEGFEVKEQERKKSLQKSQQKSQEEEVEYLMEEGDQNYEQEYQNVQVGSPQVESKQKQAAFPKQQDYEEVFQQSVPNQIINNSSALDEYAQEEFQS